MSDTSTTHQVRPARAARRHDRRRQPRARSRDRMGRWRAARPALAAARPDRRPAERRRLRGRGRHDPDLDLLGTVDGRVLSSPAVHGEAALGPRTARRRLRRRAQTQVIGVIDREDDHAHLRAFQAAISGERTSEPLLTGFPDSTHLAFGGVVLVDALARGTTHARALPPSPSPRPSTTGSPVSDEDAKQRLVAALEEELEEPAGDDRAEELAEMLERAEWAPSWLWAIDADDAERIAALRRREPADRALRSARNPCELRPGRGRRRPALPGRRPPRRLRRSLMDSPGLAPLEATVAKLTARAPDKLYVTDTASSPAATRSRARTATRHTRERRLRKTTLTPTSTSTCSSQKTVTRSWSPTPILGTPAWPPASTRRSRRSTSRPARPSTTRAGNGSRTVIRAVSARAMDDEAAAAFGEVIALPTYFYAGGDLLETRPPPLRLHTRKLALRRTPRPRSRMDGARDARRRRRTPGRAATSDRRIPRRRRRRRRPTRPRPGQHSTPHRRGSYSSPTANSNRSPTTRFPSRTTPHASSHTIPPLDQADPRDVPPTRRRHQPPAHRCRLPTRAISGIVQVSRGSDPGDLAYAGTARRLALESVGAERCVLGDHLLRQAALSARGSPYVRTTTGGSRATRRRAAGRP